MLNARVSSSRSRKRTHFGISFATLASLSTSSTASTFIAVVNNLLATALVSLQCSCVFFYEFRVVLHAYFRDLSAKYVKILLFLIILEFGEHTWSVLTMVHG